MPHLRHIGLLVLWSVLGALALPCAAVEYSVYIVTPPIADDLILQDGPLPAICKLSKTIQLAGCRGQYGSASFVVETSTPLENVRVEIDPISGPGDPWSRESVDIRLVAPYYRSPSTLPWLLVHDSRFLAIEPAPTEADSQAMTNVARGKLQDAAALQPVRIDRREQFWITIHVPDHAPAGTYKTSLRIIPNNGAVSQLGLEVEVYPFELLPPMLEYSIYYPVSLNTNLPADHPFSFGDVSSAQYTVELRNMLGHGIANPNISNAVHVKENGTLDFSTLEKILELRETVGMRPKTLYLAGHPVRYDDRPLTSKEREKNHQYVRDINAWTASRGYSTVFLMAGDEWFGEKLSRERESMRSVDEAGGKTFVAVAMNGDFFDRVGDVLHRPIFELAKPQFLMQQFARGHYEPAQVSRHMAEISQAGISALERFANNPDTRLMIDSVNRLGHRIFSYTTGVRNLPQFQRRSEGLCLWRMGFGGTMNWAYAHINLPSDRVNQEMVCATVYRTENGVLDTLRWEGVREGVDDVRYLTTLLDALNRARGTYPHDPLVRDTEQWIDEMDVFHADLETLRKEMARRTVALLNVGARKISAEEALAGIDLKSVEIAAIAKPWRWMMDVQDRGVQEKWFDPAFTDRDWARLPADSPDKGWGNATGFGWYRNELPLTEQDATKKCVALYFGACDEEAWVYVNGRLLMEHSCKTTDLLPEEIWQRPFVVPLTGVKLHGGDLLAIRVHNSAGMGGIWRPVNLILSDQELSATQIETLIKW